jgi:hypothetical protein
MSINGLQQQYYANSLDGLTYLDVNGLSINGDVIDIDNLVPYTGANKPINVGVQPIRTSYNPVANNDVVNLVTLQNAVAYIEGINVANFVPYTGANANVNLGTHTITATKVVAPTAEIDTVKVMSAGTDYSLSVNSNNLEITNLATSQKLYTDGASLWVPERLFASESVDTVDTLLTGSQYFRYGTSTQFSAGVNGSDNYQIADDTGVKVLELSKTTGATVAKLNITSVPAATPTYALGVNGSGGVVSFAVPSATNLLPLNNTWTGTNTYNNNVVMADTYTTNVNSAFGSIQAQIANASNFATGGTDFTGAMPVSVLTKPSYYNLTGAGNFGMSVGLDLGYTGGSFTAGASTTITGSWTANTVSSRIATITFDVTAHIGKSLRCVWEGVTPLVFTTSPPPFFTVVNGATTVYSSPQPISGTNTYAWNFTPTVGTTTITYTVQSAGTPSLPAFSWTGFSIKQISPSRLAYKTGAKYTATFTNIIASQLMYLSVYQYTAAGGTPLAISDISNIPVTTSAQTITITFSVNIFPTNLGTVIFFFQPTSANQYVRFDSATVTRADMNISGNIVSSVIASSAIVSANPSGNSGNGTTINMTAFNGSFGSIEVYDNVNANKLPLALQAYGGTVGVGLTNPVATFEVIGTGSICGGTNYANTNGHMAPGSLVIGDTTRNYGGGTSFWNSNTAGLLLECEETTEIAIHDAGLTVASLMYYSGNKFIMGRSMGWGVSNVETRGDLIVNGGVGKRFIKQGDNANYYATFNGGNSTNAPFIEFIAGSTRRLYIGNSTTTDNYIQAENNANIHIATNGADRMRIDPNGDIVFPYAREQITEGLNGYGQYRMVQGRYGVMWRQDGSTTYLLITPPDAQYGVWNGLRPFFVDNASGRVTMENNLTCRGGNYVFADVPQSTSIYVQPVVFDGDTFRRSQCVLREIYNSQSVAWGGGVNITYAFYNYNSTVGVILLGKYSGYWTSSTTNQIAVRIYQQNTGNYYTYYFNTFTNNTFNHVTIPLFCNVGTLGVGWHDVYVFNNSGYSTDGNDQLNIQIMTFPAIGY